MPSHLRTQTRYILLSVLFLLLLSPAARAESATDSAELTIGRASELALKNDLSAQIAAATLEEARIAYERSRAQNLLSDLRYDRQSAENTYRHAEISYEDARADVVIHTVDRYFNVLADRLDLAIKGDQLRIAEINLENTRKKAAVDSAGPIDVLDAEIQVNNAKLELEDTQHRLALDHSLLLTSLGLSQAQNILLGSEISPPPPDYELGAATPKATQRSASVYDAESALELARINLERTRAGGAAALDLRSAKIALQKAELQYEQAQNDVDLDVQQGYNDMLRAWKNLMVHDGRLEVERERDAVTQQQFDAGLNTEVQRLEGAAALAQAESNRLLALKEYIAALLSFQKRIGEPLTPTTMNDTPGEPADDK